MVRLQDEAPEGTKKAFTTIRSSEEEIRDIGSRGESIGKKSSGLKGDAIFQPPAPPDSQGGQNSHED